MLEALEKYFILYNKGWLILINREKYFNDITNRNLEKRAVKIAQFKLRISIESQKILFLPRSPKKHLHFSNVNSTLGTEMFYPGSLFIE